MSPSKGSQKGMLKGTPKTHEARIWSHGDNSEGHTLTVNYRTSPVMAGLLKGQRRNNSLLESDPPTEVGEIALP